MWFWFMLSEYKRVSKNRKKPDLLNPIQCTINRCEDFYRIIREPSPLPVRLIEKELDTLGDVNISTAFAMGVIIEDLQDRNVRWI